MDLAIRVRPPPLEDSDLVLKIRRSAPGASPPARRWCVPSGRRTRRKTCVNTRRSISAPRAQHQWRLTGPQGERVEWEHTPRLVTDDMLMLRTAAIAGAGIVQLPAMMMRDDILRGELVQLLPGWQPQGGVVHAVYPSRRGLLPAVRLLLDYLGEQFTSIEEE
ncbi:LysR substrate-binding domain-containing protein [Serratia ureilytica]